ncbi:putative Polyadenylate-binding protein [Blattamonas nauphoetae]|uniref:Polyadenylate-binding protein n=1 Tax=Blattamonas nauphoetae TaxID=2049346 RepID=A0ABQ9XDA5_9EUKA|nr:putative Polyadenylate-binding protein [Blattamonas nauphoetae]
MDQDYSDNEQLDTTNLYIRNLPYAYTDKDLHVLCAKYGNVVSAKIMVSRTGRSRGYGFVRFSDDSSAKTALEQLEGFMILDQQLSVKFSFKQKQSDEFEPRLSLYVKPISENISTDDLSDLFSRYGDVIDVKILVEPHSGKKRQIGFVTMKDLDSARQAQENLNGYKFDEFAPQLTVRYAEGEKGKKERQAKRKEAKQKQKSIIPGTGMDGEVNRNFHPDHNLDGLSVIPIHPTNTLDSAPPAKMIFFQPSPTSRSFSNTLPNSPPVDTVVTPNTLTHSYPYHLHHSTMHSTQTSPTLTPITHPLSHPSFPSELDRPNFSPSQNTQSFFSNGQTIQFMPIDTRAVLPSLSIPLKPPVFTPSQSNHPSQPTTTKISSAPPPPPLLSYVKPFVPSKRVHSPPPAPDPSPPKTKSPIVDILVPDTPGSLPASPSPTLYPSPPPSITSFPPSHVPSFSTLSGIPSDYDSLDVSVSSFGFYPSSSDFSSLALPLHNDTSSIDSYPVSNRLLLTPFSFESSSDLGQYGSGLMPSSPSRASLISTNSFLTPNMHRASISDSISSISFASSVHSEELDGLTGRDIEPPFSTLPFSVETMSIRSGWSDTSGEHPSSDDHEHKTVDASEITFPVDVLQFGDGNTIVRKSEPTSLPLAADFFQRGSDDI